MSDQEIKLCECGCGQPTPLAKSTNLSVGRVRGQPCRFIHGHNGYRGTVEQRFWTYVTPGSFTECWLWRGSVNNCGYGILGVGGHFSKATLVHRISWEIHFGPIPADLCVLHNCPGGDNPRCVSPYHLWLGDRADNNQDKMHKGGCPVGESNGNAKLTDDLVREIRKLRAQGLTYAEIKRQTGVALFNIGSVIRRETWVHVP